VQGQYGDYHLTDKTRGSRLWISPLMGLYWFFDLPLVARHNMFLSQLSGTATFIESLRRYTLSRRYFRLRPPERIPLA
jgi:hypothetical protein